MSEPEIPLSGGNTNQAVMRVGNTVRRAMTPASPTVHELLLHLKKQGFDTCPEFLGIDNNNREILSYIEGDTGLPASVWTDDEPLVASARMLRNYHDATKGFAPVANSWANVDPNSDRHEVICHNDFAPYNFVFSANIPIAVLDFDLAGPGPRLRDVAYAAFWMAPLSFHAHDMKAFAHADLRSGSKRLREFCRSYGIAADRRLVSMIAEVLADMSDHDRMCALLDTKVVEKLEREGHLEHWRNESSAFARYRPELEFNLSHQI